MQRALDALILACARGRPYRDVQSSQQQERRTNLVRVARALFADAWELTSG